MRGALRQLGRQIGSRRRELGLSLEEAAGRAEIDPKHWAAIEHALTNATVASLVGIASALRVEIRDLFAA